jgi:hypothetical protein
LMSSSSSSSEDSEEMIEMMRRVSSVGKRGRLEAFKQEKLAKKSKMSALKTIQEAESPTKVLDVLSDEEKAEDEDGIILGSDQDEDDDLMGGAKEEEPLFASEIAARRASEKEIERLEQERKKRKARGAQDRLRNELLQRAEVVAVTVAVRDVASGEIHNVKLDPREKWGSAARKLCGSLKMGSGDVSFYFDGRELPENKTIEECCIADGDEVELRLSESHRMKLVRNENKQKQAKKEKKVFFLYASLSLRRVLTRSWKLAARSGATIRSCVCGCATLRAR